MIHRTLAPVIRQRATKYPIVTLTGPRQSGKTTLVRAAFPDHPYATLEDPDLRVHAAEDPRGFLGQYPDGAVLDEVQRVPDLVSYLQGIVDEDDRPGRFMLTGSQNLLLQGAVSQSLAGRTAVLELLPFSIAELRGREPLEPAKLGSKPPARPRMEAEELMTALLTGFYPRIHDRGIDPTVWLADYHRTYVERDVRGILNVGDLETFGRFVRLCAGRTGQLLNLSGLSADAGVSHTTARRWLSVLETSFLVTLLRPHHRNFNKRLVKSPKLYFVDSGLACYLLGIRTADELRYHSARGAIFETFVVTDLLKGYLHRGLPSGLHFWRDSTGREIDVLVNLGSTQIAVEIKSGATVGSDFFDALHHWRRLTADGEAPAALVYGGERSAVREGISVWSWLDL